MNFNIVIGNPPYNRGADLDFIDFGHKVSTEYCTMVVPAKWQGTDETALSTSSITYNSFRKQTVPYMSKVVFYPNSREVFDIALGGGICYFLLNKAKPANQFKRTTCKSNKMLESSWEEFNTLDFENITLYNSTVNNIISKCKNSNIKLELFRHTMYVSDNKDKIPFSYDNSDIAIISNDSIIGYIKENRLNSIENLTKYKVIINCMRGGATDFGSDGKLLGLNKLLLAKPRQVGGGNCYVLRFFDTESEAVSFMSYLNTKLIRFLYFLGVYATGIRNATFKYVPESQSSYNHIYSDNEVYDMFKIQYNEKEIIESLIK
jgi:hypothetical protein